MVALARRWCRILGLDPDAAPPAPVKISTSDLLKAIREAIKAITEAVEADFTPPPPFPPGTDQKRQQEKDARGNADQAARATFGGRGPAPAVTGTRDPRDEETSAARRLARSLKQTRPAGATRSPRPRRSRPAGSAWARHWPPRPSAPPARSPPPSPSLTPAAAESRPRRCESASPVTSPGPWRTPPARSPRPPGSSAAPPPTPAAVTATLLYGARVQALTWPGETPDRVTEFGTPDGKHEAARAIDALDGALGLARPGTARLLALVTDTNYTSAETLAAQNRITRLHRAGCGVIILRPKDTYFRDHEWTDCQVIEIDNPAGTIDAIARAATRALNA